MTTRLETSEQRERRLERVREWKRNNRARVRELNARWDRSEHGKARRAEAQRRRAPATNAKRYGLTVEQVDALFDAQGRQCACCGTSEPRGRGIGWAIDHDHATGKVRGVLCGVCNPAIGALGDNIPGLEKALAYLRKYYASSVSLIDEHY